MLSCTREETKCQMVGLLVSASMTKIFYQAMGSSFSFSFLKLLIRNNLLFGKKTLIKGVSPSNRDVYGQRQTKHAYLHICKCAKNSLWYLSQTVCCQKGLRPMYSTSLTPRKYVTDVWTFFSFVCQN